MQDGKENVAQFELIPWILGQCASMKEVHELLDRINIVNTPFSPQFPLGSVDKQRGCCEVAEGKYEITLYTSCCNATKGIYYYNTYENHQISGVDMHRENLDSDHPIRYPAIQGEKIHFQN